MENEIFMYTATYFALPLAAAAGLGYAVYHALRPARVTVDNPMDGLCDAQRRANSVFEDRC